MRRPLLVLLLTLSVSCLLAQNPIAVKYGVQQLREEFSEQNDNWTYMSTVENLYMPDKGDLFMHRNNSASAYAFITKWKNDLREFNIMARLKLGPMETADQSIGVICLVQRNGKGAVVVEFNKFRQYRIKQLVGAYYRYVSGKPEDYGWVKNKAVRGDEDYNELDIRVSLPQVDVYINGKFMQSFDVQDYTPGEMGIAIGPDTKAKADYFYVYSTESAVQQAEALPDAEKVATTPAEQLGKMRYELEMKERDLRECNMERIKAVSVLEDQVGALTTDNQRLTNQNRQLAEFRDHILVDIDEDAFLTIAKSLKEEVLKNERLETQVQVYRDSLKLTHQKYNKLKLALLDKSIKKAEKEKVERERQESIATKQEIEAELKDARLTKEQEEWEKKHYKPGPEVKTVPEPKASPVAKTPETKAEEKTVEAAPAKAPVAEVPSSPLPIPVRKAVKKID